MPKASPAVAAERAAERERLDDAWHVLGQPGNPFKQNAYAIYVAVLLSLTYGFTVMRALFLTSDPAALRADLLSWPAAVVVAVLIGGAWLLGRWAGRIRGPITPPLPWIDHVVAPTDLDRALTLRRWWTVAVTGAVAAGAITGGVLGGSFVAAKVGGVLWLVGALVAALAIALVGLAGWLTGQSRLGTACDPGARPGPSRALRRLRVDDLRAHATMSARLGGAVLLADLRSIRLTVAPPITRGRSARLRPGRGWVVVARRDLLGLRRMPSSLALGVGMSGLGAVALTWVRFSPEVPAAFALLAMVPCYFGVGAFAEGVRAQGDNLGTPALLGLAPAAELRAHLVVPTAGAVLAGGVSAAVVAGSLIGAGAIAGAALWMAPITLVSLGAQLISAFRGPLNASAFGPRQPGGVIALMALPCGLAMIVGGLMSAWSRVAPGDAAQGAVFGGAVLLAIGLGRAKVQGNKHRS